MQASEVTLNQLFLEPADNERLNKLCGPANKHLRQMEEYTGVLIKNRGHAFRFTGGASSVERVKTALRALYESTRVDRISPQQVFLALRENDLGQKQQGETEEKGKEVLETLRTACGWVRARSHNQSLYLGRIRRCDLNFGIGPAGTGKTYLAVAAAVAALLEGRVQRIILTRPAVEAGEHLGFLPGDMVQKVDPYLRPLYDVLHEMLGLERSTRLQEQGMIESAPLAFMRGRTLNNAFVILDEAQNTTHRQMKMFLTRLGFGSTAVVTGDLSQIDLTDRRQSGLEHARQVLRNLEAITFTFFDKSDVLRHTLVTHIVNAYQDWEERDKPNV